MDPTKQHVEEKARLLSSILKDFYDIVQKEYFMSQFDFDALKGREMDEMFFVLESVYDKVEGAYSELTNKLYELFK